MPEATTRRSRRTSSVTEHSGEWIPLPPDPAILSALGGGHTLASALADTIDNSIDAHASRIKVRFITHHAELRAIQIRDDGSGMSPERLKQALRLGHRRDYNDQDIGHFGIGLKAASMRHARVLRVYSAEPSSTDLTVSALELRVDHALRDQIGARVISEEESRRGFRFGYEGEPPSSGTVVEWTDLVDSSRSTDRAIRARWLDATLQEVRSTLGLAFHRLIESGALRIEIDCYELGTGTDGEAGVPRRVDAINPFHYTLSGSNGYPRALTATTADGINVTAHCHVLPPRGTDLLPGARENWQGVYVYRNHRLLTLTPDWLGLETSTRDLRLARLVIDVTDELLPHIRPLPEKNGVTLTAEMVRCLSSATDAATGQGMPDFRDAAISAWKDSNRRSTEKPITRVLAGLPDELISTLGESLGWRQNQDPTSIRWKDLMRDRLFELDLPTRTLLLNRQYSAALGGEDSPAAQLFATILHLLLESHFTRASHLRATTYEHFENLNTVLLAALASVVETPGRNRTTDSTPRGIPDHVLAALLQAGHGTDAQIAAEPEYDGQAVGLHATRPGSVAASDDTRPADEEQAATETNGVIDTDGDRPARNAPHAAHQSLRMEPRKQGVALSPEDLEAFELYCTGSGITEIARNLARSEASIATSLTLSLFSADATIHDPDLAYRHGLPYSPDERERILTSYRAGRGNSVIEIAHAQGRTPLSIAWHLLDSPRRPVQIDKRVRRDVRRRVRSDPQPDRVEYTEI